MRVVVLTGAGISAESGLSTFRDSGGLWDGHDPMQVATPEAYADDPALVQRFYDERRAALSPACSPTPPTTPLVRLEDALGDDLLVVTQNVDDLHERAGSRRVHHIHGRLRSAWCTTCGGRHEWDGPAGPRAALPRLRRDDAAARHRLVRRDPLRHGPRRAGAGRVRPVRVHRHLGRGLPRCRLRPLGRAARRWSSTSSRVPAPPTSHARAAARRPRWCRRGSRSCLG